VILLGRKVSKDKEAEMEVNKAAACIIETGRSCTWLRLQSEYVIMKQFQLMFIIIKGPLLSPR
jgi:hypothetical protein